MLPLVAVIALWAIWLLDSEFAMGLTRFGLRPRTAIGSIGILTAPVLHHDIEHLANNSISALILGWAMMYFYPRLAGRVVLVSWLVGGAFVWVFARPNIHIGASGVIYGLAVFLFVSGLIRKQRTLMALTLLVVLLYGSMVWGVFPIVPDLSWESHLSGAVVGAFLAWYHRGVPPAVSDPKPSFADEEDEDPSGTDTVASEEVQTPNNVSTTWDRPAQGA
ncbi:MAG TPA: rhomboid family intramembrane serine protease [Flavobacteriales bacterium]|nr:rhomboid family intramembrane serine protease [Flavobacteriales bacterium]